MSIALDITDSQTSDIIINGSNTKPVLVYFWADWCAGCKSFSLTLEEIAGELKDLITIVKMNIDDEPKFSQMCMIRSLPTILIFDKEEQVGTKISISSKADFISFIKDSL